MGLADVGARPPLELAPLDPEPLELAPPEDEPEDELDEELEDEPEEELLPLEELVAPELPAPPLEDPVPPPELLPAPRTASVVDGPHAAIERATTIHSRCTRSMSFSGTGPSMRPRGRPGRPDGAARAD